MRSIPVGAVDNEAQDFIVNVYQDYYGLVKKTVMRITGSHCEVEDLVGDCFLRLIEKTSTIRELSRGKLTAYIKYTARSVAINYIKHKDVVRKHVDTAEADLSDYGSDAQPDVDDRLIQESELELLSKAILQLPEKTKNLLYFKYLLGMTDEQISQIYSISTDSVRTYLSRARKDAKRLIFEENGYGQ